jgi:hypothetical protein
MLLDGHDMVGKSRPVHGLRTLMVLMEKARDGLVFIKVLAADLASAAHRVASSQRQDTELSFYFMYLGKPASVALGNPDIGTLQNNTCGELMYFDSLPITPLCSHPPRLMR